MRRRRESLVFKTYDYLLLAAAFASFVFSVVLWFSGLRDQGLFVGIWVPSILAFGGYVKTSIRR
jgi:ABC-type multidrug transport system permease subunit